MKKTDDILKKASIYEDLAYCENVQSRKVLLKKIAQEAQEVSFSPETIKSRKFQVPDKLSTKEDVRKFQENLLNYVDFDPTFDQQLTKALGESWGEGDVDGIAGPRTMKAWNMYKQYAGTTDPNIDINKKREQSSEVGVKLLNDFRNKLRAVRQSIAKNTSNFTKRFNVGSDKVQQAFTPFLQYEYGQLQTGYNQFQPELKQEFTNLVQYMQKLFGSYMQAPPEEPRSVLNVEYMPEEI